MVVVVVDGGGGGGGVYSFTQLNPIGLSLEYLQEINRNNKKKTDKIVIGIHPNIPSK